MRVIAGAAKGRRLQAPPGERTRPTTDRVKEALFSMLQPELPGARFLDLYAGSGALGIEALSRGAAHATFVERDRRALQALHDNLDVADVADRATVAAVEVAQWLGGSAPAAEYDIVVLDPPYDLAADTLAAVLRTLVAHLAPHATVTVERSVHDAEVVWPAPLIVTRERRYGDTVLQTATISDGGSGA